MKTNVYCKNRYKCQDTGLWYSTKHAKAVYVSSPRLVRLAQTEVFTKTYLIKAHRVLASGESCLQEISVPKLNPFSEVDININRCTDGALHVHTHLGIAFY